MKTIVNINGKTKEEVLISKLEIENRDLKRQISELKQASQLQQTGVIKSVCDHEKQSVFNSRNECIGQYCYECMKFNE